MEWTLDAVGRRLKARRSALGLTLREVAQRSGLSERYVILAEQGSANLSLNKAHLLAAALELPLMALVTEGERGSLDELLAGRTPAEVAEVAAWARRRFADRSAGTRPMIALLGVRGAGKSTVGRRLAARLRRPFVELDAQIEKQAGLSLAEVFSVHGDDYYRRLESESLDALFDAGEPAVLATGGSIVTHADNFERLRQMATTLWLRARPEDHWDRVLQQGDRRPMRDHPHALAELRALLAAREPLYRLADCVVDATDRTIDAVVDAAVEGLATRGVPA